MAPPPQTTCPVFHCTRSHYARDLPPVGYANNQSEARAILMRVFEGTYSKPSIEVELAQIHIGREGLWAYWPTDEPAVSQYSD
jgi:hypothetical protein